MNAHRINHRPAPVATPNTLFAGIAIIITMACAGTALALEYFGVLVK